MDSKTYSEIYNLLESALSKIPCDIEQENIMYWVRKYLKQILDEMTANY